LSRVIQYEGLSNGLSPEVGVKKFQEMNRTKFKTGWRHAFKNLGNDWRDLDLQKDRNVVQRALLDAETPRADFNAGGYTTVQEMRLLQALVHKCTFVAQNLLLIDWHSAALRRIGIVFIYAPVALPVNKAIETSGSEFDLVYATRYGIAT